MKQEVNSNLYNVLVFLTWVSSLASAIYLAPKHPVLAGLSILMGLGAGLRRPTFESKE